jgi:acetyltransferase-like isoleucine patch superfamily enzyme
MKTSVALCTYNGQSFLSEQLNSILNQTNPVDEIIICDDCFFASRVYITDHNHGDTSEEMLGIVPNKRPLISKGPVLIKKSVWVGEGVCIMPNVTIGENSIIASNAVVTKDVPANSVVAGVPAIVIKKIK